MKGRIEKWVRSTVADEVKNALAEEKVRFMGGRLENNRTIKLASDKNLKRKQFTRGTL